MKGIGVEMKGIGVGNKICGQSDGVKTGWFSQQTGPNDRVWEWKKSTGVNKSCFHNRWGQKEWFSQQTRSQRMVFTTDGVQKEGFQSNRVKMEGIEKNSRGGKNRPRGGKEGCPFQS